jgi:hypothetical protein
MESLPKSLKSFNEKPLEEKQPTTEDCLHNFLIALAQLEGKSVTQLRKYQIQFQYFINQASSAARLLQKVLVREEDPAYSFPLIEACLLHAGVLAEQTALAVLASQVPPAPNQSHPLDKEISVGNLRRPLRLSHRITDFLQEIGSNMKLDSQDHQRMQNLTDFLVGLYHYPTMYQNRLFTQSLMQLGNLHTIRRELINNEGWVSPKTFRWCCTNLGEDQVKWVTNLENHLKSLFNDEILPHIRVAIEVSSSLLEYLKQPL